MADPVTSPKPDLALVRLVDLLDEIGKRYLSAVLITERHMDDDHNTIGLWPSEGTCTIKIAGLLTMAQHWHMTDPDSIINIDDDILDETPDG